MASAASVARAVRPGPAISSQRLDQDAGQRGQGRDRGAQRDALGGVGGTDDARPRRARRCPGPAAAKGARCALSSVAVIGDILQPTHLLFILVIALLVLGPKRLPEVGRSLGRGLRDFKVALSSDEHDDEAPAPASPPA
ncbi:MAG: hypothetical protein DLM64_01445, partial [Solirubrobacterales bacterium]